MKKILVCLITIVVVMNLSAQVQTGNRKLS